MKISIFFVVKFSVYLNRCVFVMRIRGIIIGYQKVAEFSFNLILIFMFVMFASYYL